MNVYKKLCNSFTAIIMGLSGIAMVLLYIYKFINFQSQPYFITRAKI